MKKRDLLEKDAFMEGNRQKWAGIFTIMAGLVMLAQILFKIDPTPYLTLLTFIGSFLIGGTTLTEFVKTKAFEAKSTSASQYTKEEVSVDINIDIKDSVIEQSIGEAPTVKPFTQFMEIGENFETTSDIQDKKDEKKEEKKP